MNDSPVTKVIGLIAITAVVAIVYQTCYLPATADPIRHVAICGRDEFVVVGSFRRGRVEVWDLALTSKFSVPDERGRVTISALKASKRLPIVCISSWVSGGDHIDESFWLETDRSHRIDLSCDRIWQIVDDNINQITDIVVSKGDKASICRFHSSREFERIAPIPEDGKWIRNGVGYRSTTGEYFWVPHGDSDVAWQIHANGEIQDLSLASDRGRHTVYAFGFLPERGTFIGMGIAPHANTSELNYPRCLYECSALDDESKSWSCTPIQGDHMPEFPAWADFGVGVEHVIGIGYGGVDVWQFGPEGKVELRAHRDKPL